MADLETALRTLTLQNPAVSTAFGTRFHWDHIPDNETYPCIRATTITDNPGDTHTNTWGGRERVQIDVYDDDKATCNASAETVRSWLHRYKGGMGSQNVTILVRNVMGGWEADARLFRRIMELEILYTNV